MKNIKNNIIRILEMIIIFLLCGSLYCIMEILYKYPNGQTHWTMFTLAGLSGVFFIDGLNNVFTYEMDFLLQIFLCATFITIGEYFVGICFNQNFEIWNYTDMPFNYKGQVCLPFYLLWCVLSGVAIPILDYIEWKFFKFKENIPPYYKTFGKKIFSLGGR